MFYLKNSFRFQDNQKKNWLDQKAKVNFKIYNVTTWETNNCNIHIAQYLRKLRQSDKEHFSFNMRNISHEKSYPNVVEKLFPDPFLKTRN